jgi:hypothetical protein
LTVGVSAASTCEISRFEGGVHLGEIVGMVLARAQAERAARKRPLSLGVMRHVVLASLPGEWRYALSVDHVRGGLRVTFEDRAIATLGDDGALRWVGVPLPPSTPDFGSPAFMQGHRAFKVTVCKTSWVRRAALDRAVGRGPRRVCARGRRSPRARRSSAARDDGPGEPEPGEYARRLHDCEVASRVALAAARRCAGKTLVPAAAR